jgi:hypothetical protein
MKCVSIQTILRSAQSGAVLPLMLSIKRMLSSLHINVLCGKIFCSLSDFSSFCSTGGFTMLTTVSKICMKRAHIGCIPSRTDDSILLTT